MKNTIFMSIICIFLFLYCTKDKSSISSSCIITDGEFIIDSYDINAVQKRNPETDSLCCLINNNIQYHFENDMGHLSQVIFKVENHHYSYLWLTGDQRYSDIIYSLDIDFWIKDLANNEDSLTINYYFEGIVGSNLKCLSKFNDSINVTIPINRTE